jgi:hypothetical protein
MAARFIAFALLFVVCSFASPLRVASVYDSPILLHELEEPHIDQEPVYALNKDSDRAMDGNTDSSSDVEKRSAEEANDDDLETAAGTNVLRPLFVYRQQVAYRQRVKEANRRGRRI